MAFTAVCTAYASLVNVLSMDSRIRQVLTAVRNAFNSGTSIILGAIAMPMILFFGKSDVATAKGYFWTTVILSHPASDFLAHGSDLQRAVWYGPSRK